MLQKQLFASTICSLKYLCLNATSFFLGVTFRALHKAQASHTLMYACTSLFYGMEEKMSLLWELMAPPVQAESFTLTWGILDLAKGSWSQVSFGMYLPMDCGVLLPGSVWSPFEIPQGVQCFQAAEQAGCWAHGRGWRVVSFRWLQGSLEMGNYWYWHGLVTWSCRMVHQESSSSVFF